MNLQEHVPLASKTTMRIGGRARYYAELSSKDDVEEAHRFAQEHTLPLIPLGGGSNTIFADGTINALIVRIKADQITIGKTTSYKLQATNFVTVEAGKHLAQLVNELAQVCLDLSPLTGIPGTVGGAIFGNAGQGPKGLWIDSFVQSVTVFADERWQTLSRKECVFAYRESIFKRITYPLIWSTTLSIPSKPAHEVEQQIDLLLNKRIETQPHLRTAGSCFKACQGVPAWKLIDRANLRGKQIGSIQIAQKHANFLLNLGTGTFEEAKRLVKEVQNTIPESLEVEMRFIDNDGHLAF